MGKPSDLFGLDRIRSAVRLHAAGPSPDSTAGGNTADPNLLPTYNVPSRNSSASTSSKAGGLSEKYNAGVPPGPSDATGGRLGSQRPHTSSGNGGEATTLKYTHHADVDTLHGDVTDEGPENTPPAAPPPHKSEDARIGDTAIEQVDSNPEPKPPLFTRFKTKSHAVIFELRDGICYSWVNVLLIFVPVGIIVEAIGLSASIIFALNAVAIVPLAGLLAHATECVAARLGDTLGALLNVSFGNAVELIIFIIALVKNEVSIVQASLLGSILANLLLILGMAFLFGGLRYREQLYNSTVTQMSACLLSLSVMSLLLPTAFHASFNESSSQSAETNTLAVSRGTSVVLLVVYVLYLLFQLKSHAYMYESTPQAVIDEESHPGVLADMLGSSSSSDDSSSSSSSDTDSSGSGSIITKKFRRKFKSRRRRKSSTSSESVTTASPSVPSVISSPSTERQGNYWEMQIKGHQSAPRRESSLGAIADGNEADADNEDENGIRSRDFGKSSKAHSKSPENKRHRRKHFKKHCKKHRRNASKQEKADSTTEATDMGNGIVAINTASERRVGFTNDILVTESPEQVQTPGVGGRAFNMHQISAKSIFPRPQLPKMLSQNVFVTPPPPQAGSPSPGALQAPRTVRRGGTLRRTSSLPDRLNGQYTTPAQVSSHTTGPLPPFTHQARSSLRKVTSTDPSNPEVEEVVKPEMSRTSAVLLLIISTALVAVCAEFMVDAIPEMIDSSPVSQAFIGLIILPIVGNAAEHVTAVTVAAKNKMDLAIGVAVGSSIQIALFVTPLVVLLGWILDTNMSLYFNLFETISLFVTAFVVNFLVLDGRSNYLEGSLLIAAYIIIAVGAFFYPSEGAQSAVGGGSGGE
ncbi:hypothetical protein K431DRAFT_343370 [Polychaeton citri CBS 116435]|uniref:Sodium/calcium exchanger membrane region domain-containing protein n=1 Tax=Polychaeton citri CBS 116435 TaxID=1314669 RepID=A0A9P4UTM6_9PEZI|nr:hypothetical protein K431DRAFT_343370 [Polychaeton citri CBS 116435]